MIQDCIYLVLQILIPADKHIGNTQSNSSGWFFKVFDCVDKCNIKNIRSLNMAMILCLHYFLYSNTWTCHDCFNGVFLQRNVLLWQQIKRHVQCIGNVIIILKPSNCYPICFLIVACCCSPWQRPCTTLQITTKWPAGIDKSSSPCKLKWKTILPLTHSTFAVKTSASLDLALPLLVLLQSVKSCSRRFKKEKWMPGMCHIHIFSYKVISCVACNDFYIGFHWK